MPNLILRKLFIIILLFLVAAPIGASEPSLKDAINEFNTNTSEEYSLDQNLIIKNSKNLENLVFASGKVKKIVSDKSDIIIETFLNEEGMPRSEEVQITVNESTLLVSSVGKITFSSLRESHEIDIEYDKKSKIATYLFQY